LKKKKKEMLLPSHASKEYHQGRKPLVVEWTRFSEERRCRIKPLISLRPAALSIADMRREIVFACLFVCLIPPPFSRLRARGVTIHLQRNSTNKSCDAQKEEKPTRTTCHKRGEDSFVCLSVF
jgi:hypothetical protein